MKIKRFISGTYGRIKPDVSDVDSGLHTIWVDQQQKGSK